jgi:hypothetical protein
MCSNDVRGDDPLIAVLSDELLVGVSLPGKLAFFSTGV